MEITAIPATCAHAARQGVDIDAVAKATGRSAIAREDVDRHLRGETGPAAPGPDPARYWAVDHAAHGPVAEEPMPRLAQVASANLSAAHGLIPSVTHHDRADVSAIEALRHAWRPEADARGIKLTAMAFQAKALACALRRFPRFNASLSSDGRTLTLKHYVHIGIAVDTPHGLMVPVVRDADRKGLWQIATEIGDLAALAQDRKIGPD